MTDEVTAAQAALLTGLSERTIRRRIASGHLPARRLSANRFAIRVDDLPLRGGGGTVVARQDTLEARLRTLEEQVASIQAALAEVMSATTTSAGQADAPTVEQLRSLVSQLGQETERLAPILGYPSPDGTLADASRPRTGVPAHETAQTDQTDHHRQPRAREHAAQ